ncbi:uncharacterized protein LOC135169326 isoform X2 [Diachasmimorpha longicaudata]|uniref:uncharacterized protein LOC135169326 isoform X2 n=1 Tax=Diachasmimorpha longicaudata TaxID=58733 RepID=UPI0030B87394
MTPNPLPSGDPPKMIWDSIKTQVAKVDAPARGTATSASGTVKQSTLPPRLIAKMKKFQQPGWRTTPVFLMGGTPDKIFFGATVTLIAVGFVGCIDFVARSLSPNK